MTSCRNATDVLPADLVAEVQKHYGGLLWVPKAKTFHKTRRRLVEDLLRRDVPTAEVAEMAKLTVRRVQQIRKAMADTADRRPPPSD